MFPVSPNFNESFLMCPNLNEVVVIYPNLSEAVLRSSTVSTLNWSSMKPS